MTGLPPLPSWRQDHAASAARLQTLTAWRRGARVALVVAPAAGAAGPVAPAAAAVAAAAAFAVALAACALTELTRRDTLRACVLHPELRQLPAVARERSRLTDAAQRRRLARALRRVAVYRPRSVQERRLTPYPLERLAAARPGLLALADAVEATAHPDPAVLVEIDELLRDGSRSPLLRTDIPLPQLSLALDRARQRLAADTQTPTAAVLERRPFVTDADDRPRPPAPLQPHDPRRRPAAPRRCWADRRATNRVRGSSQGTCPGGTEGSLR